MSKVRMSKKFVGLAAAAVAVLSLEAAADNYGETLVKSKAVRSETVSFEDLDLGSVQGRESLHYRLRDAARRVCGSDDYRVAGGLGAAADNRACYERAMGDALSQVNAGQVAVVID
ncbi:UrcA family protein [Parahaliea mediterranea]|uniref:UrcA family protein n=1 Tax=Parahaliea mediterranea TaxID=651086 RepID=A0A939IKK0_9GAMM|nr:UrcA family protein [Parahaliea mediterranea]MBN7795047.1 UrcA family protein [Parahaliea mediterranea]